MNNEIMREYLPFLPEWTPYLMYSILFIVVAGIVWVGKKKLTNYNVTFRELISEIGKALKENKGEIKERIVQYVIAQKKVRRMKSSGFMHMCIFYSMILLFIGTFLIFMEQDILRYLGIDSLIKGKFYLAYELVLDLSGLLLIVGVVMAIIRRTVTKPSYLRTSWESYAILGSFLYIAITGFVLEAIRLVLHPVEWAAFSFVGYGISSLFGIFSAESLGMVYTLLWWSHFVVVMLLFILLPLTVLKHIILIPLNLVLQPVDRAKAKMTTPFKVTELEEMGEEEELNIGISKVADLSWKQRINLAACIQCGRCESGCPAYASGRELSPRELVLKLKGTFDHSTIQEEGFFESGLISENEVWSCTNCGACVEECPAMINHVDYIIDLRRHLVAENQLDQQKSTLFTNLDQNYNAYGLPSYKRNDWLEQLGIPLLEQHPTAEYLYYIGDVSAYDPRAQQVVKSFISILQAAQVDFAILTHEEKNEGEIAKRMGEEGRYQLIAMELIMTLAGYNVKKIVTHDPHSFNMLKNEYPEFGGQYEVMHHTVLINQLLSDNRLPVNSKLLDKVVFHDPCNLSRWNNIVEEPRSALTQVLEKPLLEIEQSKDRSFCCGAGGGNYWYKVPEQEKISSLRLQQLTSVEPETIAVACPYCLMMLEDATRTSEQAVKVRDLSEIVSDAIQKSAG